MNAKSYPKTCLTSFKYLHSQLWLRLWLHVLLRQRLDVERLAKLLLTQLTLQLRNTLP